MAHVDARDERDDRYDSENETTALWEDYQNARSYQAATGLTTKIPLFRRFYEGDQWPKYSDKTKNMPRPVVNFVKMICRNKKAMILSTPVRIIYEAEREDASVERFNRFSEYIQKEIGQERIDKAAIDDGVQTGTYVFHYYWDAEARGKSGIAEGGMRCELIDPLNIFFSDPTQKDEQKQRWIIIASREEVKAVRAKADADVDADAISADDAEDPYHAKEQDGTELCTVLTRYFRKDGEVYIEKATKSVIVNKPFPLTPDVKGALRHIRGDKEDAPNDTTPDKGGDKPLAPEARAYLYPVVVGNYDSRANSIYGLGEVEGLIPNQKAVNFNIAMMLYAVQQNAWGKVIALPNALNGQQITNEPGQVITDFSGSGNGIRFMNGNQLPGDALKLVDTITSLSRTVTGSSEVMTGETVGANMSGAAIAQLQSQALLPVEDLKNTFWEVKERQGKVMAQFYKLFYRDKDFYYKDEVEIRDAAGNPVLDEDGNHKKQEQTFTDRFVGADYAGMEFSVVVEATAGTHASAAGDISALDTALKNGAISIETYFELYPRDAISNRKEIIDKLKSDEANKVAALQQQIDQLNAQLNQAGQTLQQQQQAFDRVQTLIQENMRLKQTVATLYGESMQKITEANRVIEERTADATALAQGLAKAQGLM